MRERQREELRAWARRLPEAPPSRQAAEAARRAIDLLLDEVDRLERELEAHVEVDRARERERAQAEREEKQAELDREREARRAELEREREERRAEREREREERERRRAERGRTREATAVAAREETVRPIRPVATNGAPRRSSGNGAARRVSLPRPRGLRPRLSALPAPRLPVLSGPRASARRVALAALRRPPLPGRRTLAVGAALVLVVVAALVASRLAAPEIAVAGPPSGALVGAEAAERLTFAITGDPDALARAEWRVDGERVTAGVRVADGRAVLDGSRLADGEHTIEVTVPGSFPGTAAERRWRVEIDRTPPKVAVDKKSTRAPPARPITITGRAEEGARVTVAGVEARVEGDRFAAELAQPPAGRVAVVAVDRFGNRAETAFKVTLVPRKPRAPIRSVHVTFHAWANDALRKDILRLVDEGRINSVELDLKDESGIVGFDADVPFGRKIGAVQKIYDLNKAIDLLHSKGVHVIGRIVAFRDPVHAQAAWRRGWRDQVIQTPGGAPYAGYGGFTNFANPVVRQYNIDVARRAAEAGIDDILYDYIRRPDGPISSMVFPGLKGKPERSIASFLADARRHLQPYGLFLGASVFGVAATRPDEVAQDISAMARHADYIAPMLYPSHWGPGEYNVANPNAQPYDITFRSLKDFQKEVKGTGARVVPWLQDFSLGVTYGPAEVRAQIKAARDVGIDEWILWDAEVTYTAAALDRHPRLPPIKTVRHEPKPPAPAPAAATKPAKDAKGGAGGEAAAAARRAKANELGLVPVIMHHQIRADGGGDYDLTPAQFRAELARLYREGYRPIRAVDLATGKIDLPAGMSPVVLTFDDSTKEQLAWDAAKRPKRDTAIAIMLEFARTHEDFRPAGTFYVNRDPFAGVPEGPEMLRWLHANGFELGNHTFDHIPFTGMTPQQVQRQLVLGQQLILDAVPDAQVRTLALPLGVMPTPARLARSGSFQGKSYRHAGVFLVGAEPAPSPFSRAFRPGAIPRIRTSPPGAREPEYGSTYWLDYLRKNRGQRYVSDGDPDRVSFPKARAGDLAPRYSDRATSY